jgi:hypothetical protein
MKQTTSTRINSQHETISFHLPSRLQTPNMSDRLKRNALILKKLIKAKEKDRKKILDTCCDRDFITCVSECCKNLFKGKVRLTPSQKRNLSRRIQLMRQVVLKSTPLYKKRKIIQKGGFLGALLAPLASLIGGLFSGGK